MLTRDFAGWGTVHDIDGFMDTTSRFLSARGITPDNTRMIYSVCPDEINRLHCRPTIELALQARYDGEFHLGNLAAYPAGGITGIAAASHHVPEHEGRPDGSHHGNIVILASPHVGVSLDHGKEYGKVLRPCQDHASTCCGAMMAFLKAAPALLDRAGPPSLEALKVDPVKEMLFHELVSGYKADIEALIAMPDHNDRVIALAKVNHALVSRLVREEVDRFLAREPFKGHVALIGGITVNTPGGDFFVLKDLELLR